MKPTTTIILPGLDGTDLLLAPFCELAPESHDVTVYTLPDDPTTDYDTLCDHYSERIRSLETCHLIAESFSGPLGILLAHRHPEIIERLTLVATFATSPAPFAARIIPWSILFRLPMPSLVARRYFVGQNQSLIVKLKNAVRQTSAQTLSRRMYCMMNIDVTTQLSELNCDVEYLRPTNDRLVPKRSLNTIINANPSVSIHEIDGPHLILQTQPKRAWECILDGHRDPNVPITSG
jgi:pimeloyl-[acyl-carrier protein] methyl ester esterase